MNLKHNEFVLKLLYCKIDRATDVHLFLNNFSREKFQNILDIILAR